MDKLCELKSSHLSEAIEIGLVLMSGDILGQRKLSV
jgi:hypothetical protein